MNNEQNFRKFCPIRPVLPHTPCFAPHALKGQKLLAQGIALGYYGRLVVCHYTQGDALG
jgi:hypothetical protein